MPDHEHWYPRPCQVRWRDVCVRLLVRQDGSAVHPTRCWLTAPSRWRIRGCVSHRFSLVGVFLRTCVLMLMQWCLVEKISSNNNGKQNIARENRNVVVGNSWRHGYCSAITIFAQNHLIHTQLSEHRQTFNWVQTIGSTVVPVNIVLFDSYWSLVSTYSLGSKVVRNHACGRQANSPRKSNSWQTWWRRRVDDQGFGWRCSVEKDPTKYFYKVCSKMIVIGPSNHSLFTDGRMNT